MDRLRDPVMQMTLASLAVSVLFLAFILDLSSIFKAILAVGSVFLTVFALFQASQT